MWLFRYSLPGVFAVALGIFVAQNIYQKTAIHFLFWKFYEVPLIWIIAVTFVIGFIIRYYTIFVRWMGRKHLERAERSVAKALKDEKPEASKEVKEDYSEKIEGYAEEKMRRRIEDIKDNESKKD